MELAELLGYDSLPMLLAIADIVGSEYQTDEERRQYRAQLEQSWADVEAEAAAQGL